MPRVLLLASTTGYQVHSFADAAARQRVDLVLATDRCHVMEDPWGDGALAIGYDDLESRGPYDGVLAVGDQPALLAAQAADKLGLRYSGADAVAIAHDKFRARERFAAAGMLVPEFRLNREPARYPCVVKPLGLSGSRGVIRANNAAEFAEARARIEKMIGAGQSILTEDFIPGHEFA